MHARMSKGLLKLSKNTTSDCLVVAAAAVDD